MSPFPVMVALLCALPLAAQEPACPAEFRPVREHIQEGIRGGAAPSLALAVIRGGRVVWAEGFGLGDLERKTPATADSIYVLASVSKPITATGLMVLKDRGLVDLDQPANRYLGAAKLRAFAGSADDITLRRLANHTAGLALHWNFFYEGSGPPPRDETIRRYGFAAWAPGTEWGYSNLAFGVLDHVTERVGGASWREFMEKNVFDPLGMTRTSDRVRPGREGDATAPYEADVAGRFIRVAPYGFDHPGASAVRSSARDLAAFVLMHLGDGALEGARVLSPESARAMRTQTSRRADGGGNGVGWFTAPAFGRPSFSHTGGMPGVSTMVRAFPEEKHATIVLTNSSSRVLTTEVTRRLTAVLFPDGRPDRTPEPEAAGDLDAHVGSWKGRLAHYEGDIPLTLTVGKDKTATLGWGRETVKLREVGVRGGRLMGEAEGLLRSDTGFRGTPLLRFQLRLSGDRLTGVCMALAPGYFCLSHWVDLTRDRGND